LPSNRLKGCGAASSFQLPACLQAAAGAGSASELFEKLVVWLTAAASGAASDGMHNKADKPTTLNYVVHIHSSSNYRLPGCRRVACQKLAQHGDLGHREAIGPARRKSRNRARLLILGVNNLARHNKK
jgi:hypothetical protein